MRKIILSICAMICTNLAIAQNVYANFFNYSEKESNGKYGIAYCWASWTVHPQYDKLLISNLSNYSQEHTNKTTNGV